jgi:hypothetical protein
LLQSLWLVVFYFENKNDDVKSLLVHADRDFTFSTLMAHYYRLSNHYELSVPSEVTATSIETSFYLLNKPINEVYLINEAIHLFLSFFQQPISFLEAVEKFASALGNTAPEVTVTVNHR